MNTWIPQSLAKFEVWEAGKEDYLSGDVTGVAGLRKWQFNFLFNIAFILFSISFIIPYCWGFQSSFYKEEKLQSELHSKPESETPTIARNKKTALAMKGRREEGKTIYYHSFY